MNISNKVIIATLLFIAINSAYAQKQDGGKGQKHQRPEFSEIDTNENGEIDLAEFSQQQLPFGDYETVFNHIDADSNGVISQDEFASHKPPHKRRHKHKRPAFTEIDSNGDGMIDQDEYSNFKPTHKKGAKHKHCADKDKHKHQHEQVNDEEDNSDD